MNSKSCIWGKVVLVFLIAVALAALPASAGPTGGKNGTTLAAVKTIDICDAGDGQWRYSGEVSVWNEGAVATSGLAIQDCIQNKTGTLFVDVYCNNLSVSEIAAGTTEGTATTFSYSFLAAPLSGDIRNAARLTILNHSGSLGIPKGPEPKATWLGEVGPCPVECGCTFSQGYWGNKPDVIWPAPYDRNALFFLSTNTWQYYLDNPGGNGYNILAVQYIAATLDQANGSCVPSGVQDVLTMATAWLNANGPGACPKASSCGVQKDWAKILDDYIQGAYPGSPGHCGE